MPVCFRGACPRFLFSFWPWVKLGPRLYSSGFVWERHGSCWKVVESARKVLVVAVRGACNVGRLGGSGVQVFCLYRWRCRMVGSGECWLQGCVLEVGPEHKGFDGLGPFGLSAKNGLCALTFDVYSG